MRLTTVVFGMAMVNVFVTLLGLVTAPLLARALGPDGRGTLAAILVPLTLALALADLGLPTYASRMAARGEPVDRLIGSAGALLLVLGLLTCLLATPLAAFLAAGRPVVFTYLLAGLLVMPVSLLASLLVSIGVGLERWRAVIASRVAFFGLNAAIVIFLYAADRLTVATAASTAIVSATLATLAPMLPLLRTAGRPRFRREVARDALRFGVRVWIGAVTALAVARIDQILMIRLVEPAELGLYVVAVSWAALSGTVTAALGPTLLPRAARGDVDLPARALRVMLAVVLLVNLFLAAVAPFFIPLLFTSSFEASVKMAWILLAASVPAQGVGILSAVLTAAGRPGRVAIAQFLTLGVTAASLALVLPFFGGVGAAVVALVSSSTTFAFLVYVATRHFGGSGRDFLLIRREDIAWALSLLRNLLRRQSGRGRAGA